MDKVTLNFTADTATAVGIETNGTQMTQVGGTVGLEGQFMLMDHQLKLELGVGLGMMGQLSHYTGQVTGVPMVPLTQVASASALWKLRDNFYAGVTAEATYAAYHGLASSFVGLGLATASDDALGFRAAVGYMLVQDIQFHSYSRPTFDALGLKVGIVAPLLDF